MIKRITITIAAAALFAVPAQSASAAISGPERPLAQEMEHGVQPGVDSGVGTSPGAAVPEESVESSTATPVDQGIGTSPGAAEPANEPELPVYEAQQEEQEEPEPGSDEAVCNSLAAGVQLALDMVYMFESIAGAIPDLANGEAIEQWTDEAEFLTDMEYSEGCHSGGETAE